MHYSRTILPNGPRLITVPMKESPTVTVLVLVEAGSKYESKKINGISHFLEHMCFKGTKRRPKPIDIVKELDGIGAAYNAFTAQEMTGYYAKSDKKHFEKILDVVADIYLHSTLPEAEIEKEKGVIVEEIKMYNDLPPRHIHDVLMSGLYGDQAAGFDVAGTPETVRAVTSETLHSYRQSHYLASATTVVVAGGITPAHAETHARKAFAAMPSGAKGAKAAVRERQAKPALHIQRKKTDQVHLAFGIRTFDLHHENVPALRVLASALGGGMSSRLFQKMRDELGICYYIGASPEHFTDHGFLEITAGVQAARLTEAVAAILAEVRQLKDKPIGAVELARVKEYLCGTLHLGLESSDAVAEFYGFQDIVHKRLRRPDEVVAQIRAVTASDVSHIAAKYLTDANLNLAIIGAVDNKKEVEGLLHV